MSDLPEREQAERSRTVPLNYASARTPTPDVTARIVVGLLIAFLALAAGFFAIVIYMSRVG